MLLATALVLVVLHPSQLTRKRSTLSLQTIVVADVPFHRQIDSASFPFLPSQRTKRQGRPRQADTHYLLPHFPE
jgi:hypothetical protein